LSFGPKPYLRAFSARFELGSILKELLMSEPDLISGEPILEAAFDGLARTGNRILRRRAIAGSDATVMGPDTAD
jgi:hypothetical protein